jgi:HAD superfamily hydrolase (TIGR01509 family)
MEPEPMIRSIISDLGKVLILFDNAIFYRKISDFSCHSLSEIAARVNVHSSIARDFDTGRLSPRQFYAAACKALEADVGYDEFFAMYNDVFTLNPLIVKILDRLKSLHRMVLLSNTDVARFGFIRQRFPEVMLFDAYVLSYEVGSSKPDRRIYEAALEKAQAAPRECVFIDDRLENITAARVLGIQTIHLLEQTDLEKELHDLGVLI